MSGIQIVLIIFIFLIILRVIWRYRQRSIDRRLFLWWIIFWVLGIIVVVLPESINRLADLLGVGRGADVILYLAIILLFFLVFKLFTRLVKIEKSIVKIVRALALDNDGQSNTIQDRSRLESKDEKDSKKQD